MPLTKLQFQPGIIRETTNYTNAGGWFDADKVRFRQGCPEKIGGWSAVLPVTFKGACRYIHQWSDLESDRYIALGTSSHLYIYWSGKYYDITPIRAVFTLSNDPFTSGAVHTVDMVVHIPQHGAGIGDFVTFSGATTGVDNFTSDQLNQEYQVVGIPDADTIQIEMAGPSFTGNQTGGGPNVTATFLIPPGRDDAINGQGWGIPPWGGVTPGNAQIQVGWGSPFDLNSFDPLDPTWGQIRLWDIDNFGQDLVACIRGGQIYYWHHDLGHESHAVPLNQAITVNGTNFVPDQVPNIANQVIVSPNDRHLIAMACDWPETGVTKQDPLLVRWATEENAYEWQPLRTNSAGSQRLSAGSYIVCGLRTRQEILIWTDLGMWSMRYIGSPYYFGFDSIAEGLSIIGPNACINASNTVFWMDRGIFYAYTGQVQELVCSLKDFIFSDFNFLQQYKVYAGHNHSFSEVTWFYPSADSIENNRYVTYNYVDQVWTTGSIIRTAWLDMGRSEYPVATDRSGLLYFHEYGHDANGEALPAYIDSSDIDAAGGEHYLFLSRFIPDVFFRGSANCQSVGVTIFARSAPGKPKYPAARLHVSCCTPEEFIRVRDRQISFRVESSGMGVGWRLGTLRTDMQPDGRR